MSKSQDRRQLQQCQHRASWFHDSMGIGIFDFSSLDCVDAHQFYEYMLRCLLLNRLMLVRQFYGDPQAKYFTVLW
jgi:hypothetical protein